MTSSRIPLVVDALLSTFRTALPDAQILDGPDVNADFQDLTVYVGYNGDPSGEKRVATSQQDWAGLGAKRRDENVDVQCAICVGIGDATFKAVRDDVFGALNTLETALRAGLNLSQPSPTYAGITGVDYFTEETDEGDQGRAPFTVRVRTRI